MALCGNEEGEEHVKEVDDGLGKRKVNEDDEAEDNEECAEKHFCVRRELHLRRWLLITGQGTTGGAGRIAEGISPLANLKSTRRSHVSPLEKAPAWGAMESPEQRPQGTGINPRRG